MHREPPWCDNDWEQGNSMHCYLPTPFSVFISRTKSELLVVAACELNETRKKTMTNGKSLMYECNANHVLFAEIATQSDRLTVGMFSFLS